MINNSTTQEKSQDKNKNKYFKKSFQKKSTKNLQLATSCKNSQTVYTSESPADGIQLAFIGKKDLPIQSFAITCKVSREKGMRENDYGLTRTKDAWRKIYQVMHNYCTKHGLSFRLNERILAREKGFAEKYAGANYDYLRSGKKDWTKYFQRIEGYGRWHLHAHVEIIGELTKKMQRELKALVLKRLKTASKRVFDIRETWYLNGWMQYMQSNVEKTITKGFEKVRLVAKGIKKAVVAVVEEKIAINPIMNFLYSFISSFFLGRKKVVGEALRTLQHKVLDSS